MPPPVLALTIFVAVFAIATLRNVHLGILMFPVACGVGILIADMPLREVVGGFPVSIVLLAGVTYFFGIAHANGTIARVIDTVLSRAGTRPVPLTFLFFALAGAVAAMGSPQAGLVLAPVGMPVARRFGVDPVLMAIAISSGISAGGYAPTSLFGIVCYRVAREAGIELSPLMLLAVAVAANVLLLSAACFIFRRTRQQQVAVDGFRCRSAPASTRASPRRDPRLHDRPCHECHRLRARRVRARHWRPRVCVRRVSRAR
jgi:Dicarboxylate carrier protein MatC N-terminus